MRKVILADTVETKIADLRIYLTDDMRLSHEATHHRIDRIDEFLKAMCNPADYPLCRFKRWRTMGWRCAVFEKGWVFAYEIFDDGVIVRDMSHAKRLKE